MAKKKAKKPGQSSTRRVTPVRSERVAPVRIEPAPLPAGHRGILQHPNLALGARWIVGAVFLLSAAAKLIYPEQFILAIQGYDILPEFALRPFGLTFPWLELMVGAFLVAGLLTRLMAGIAGFLIVVFVGLMLVALAQGKSIDCGCFTGLIQETVGLSTLIRDTILFLLLVPVFLAPAHRWSLDARLRPLQAPSSRSLGLAGAYVALVALIGLAIANFGGGLVPSAQPASAETASAQSTPAAPASPTSAAVPIVARPPDGWRMGPEKARVEIVEFSDYECPSCKLIGPVLKRIQTENPDTVAVVYRHFPLPQHQKARPAAEAAEAAGEQGKFWEMNEALFAEQERLSTDLIPQLAERVGLNMEQYKAALASSRPKTKVQADYAYGARIGVSYTPYILVNGRVVADSSYNGLKRLVERELQK